MSIAPRDIRDAGAAPAEPGPDFLCIGQQKAGSRWLFDLLQFEPGLWMPPVPELHFFDGRFGTDRLQRYKARISKGLARYNRGRRKRSSRALDQDDIDFIDYALTYGKGDHSIAWYRGLFAPKGNLLSGDITPGYSALGDDEIAAIARAFPRLRLVLLLRDPVSRAWSAFNMSLRWEIVGRGVKEAGGDSLAAFREAATLDKLAEYMNRPAVAKRSFATAIHDAWTRHFEDARLQVLFFDDIVGCPGVVREKFRRFLELPDAPRPPHAPPPGFNRKSEKLKHEMSAEARAYLTEYFRDELLRCADRFGGPAEQWPVRHGVA